MRLILAAAISLAAASAQTAPKHAVRPERLLIRNAMIVEGNGAPAAGPYNIAIESGKIRSIGRRAEGRFDAEIDANGKYVLPGFVNLHGHTHDERAGKPMDVNYVLKLWLASGITTVRDVGSDIDRTLAIRAKSAKGEIVAPRMFVYAMFGGAQTPDEARERIREYKRKGCDGVKILGLHRDIMDAVLDEATKLGLPVAHHAGVEETNAWDDIRLKTASIEHWYGIPDAAIENGAQNFPPEYNYANEADRFRHAGRLWREANWDRLMKVLDGMVAAGVAWDPTLAIYEANRDLLRAQSQPWFGKYLHPALKEFFEPNEQFHGSYFFGWTTADEVFWKENYQIWFRALREFAKRGGVIGVGEDAGFIYQMYGFAYLRGLELHQEAGFHPLQVVQQASLNGARILRKDDQLGRVRAGYPADLIVVNGNPLANLKVLNPAFENGGIQWTLRDGIPYHVPTLMKEIADIVTKARAK